MAAAPSSSSSSSSLRVRPAPPQRAVVVALLLVVLVLLRAPCGGASRPVRDDGTSNYIAGASTVARARALDGGHHRVRPRESVATAAATATVGSAPIPPSGPSQGHN